MSGGAPVIFADLTELLSARVGGRALACSDDAFASMHHLVRAEAPQFDPNAYGTFGKIMDGWESRRRRTPGHDWCVLQLGLPGVVRGVDVDTAYFMGNHPPFASVEGCHMEGEPSIERLEEADWRPITGQVPLQRGTHNLFVSRHHAPITHVRLRMYPDGGVARLRLYGEPTRDASGDRLDLAALTAGGRPVGCSDMFFSPMSNLIAPGKPENMGGGWETRRRRDPGDDWIVVALGVAGEVDEVLIDTMHFNGNYPDRASLFGLWWPGAPDADLLRVGRWTPMLERVRLGPDAEHRFAVRAGPFTHVKLVIHPCGGVARLRVHGRAAAPQVGGDPLLEHLAGLGEQERFEAFFRCCGATRWARAMAQAGPWGSRAQLFGLAEHHWWAATEGDWLEAFTHHPELGADPAALAARFPATAGWSAGEQAGVAGAHADTLTALAEANAAYRERFGFLFILCASGRTAEEMLAAVRDRLPNAPAQELRIAAGEQAKITALRLEKLSP